MPALEDGIAVASDSGESRQQIGVGQLSDVSHVANSGDTVGNHGEVKQKHSVKDLLLDQGTATNERVITRKCKHNQKRRFICNPIGEPDDETLKRYVHFCACFENFDVRNLIEVSLTFFLLSPCWLERHLKLSCRKPSGLKCEQMNMAHLDGMCTMSFITQ